MTIELPEGAKSFSLPNGHTIDVPMGAKSMDLPDELMKPTQYSGGFNQPQKQGWTQDEINNELQQPWQKFLSGISYGVGKAYDTVKDIPTSPAEYITRKVLETSSDKYKKGFEAYDTQKQANDLMARDDALDKSSQWSHVYDTFFGDNKEQLRTEDRARLAQKYDDTFKASGLGRLGEDDNGDYYLIQPDGNNVPLNSPVQKILGDLKASGGTMGASIAGGIQGGKYAASLPIADPRLKALATTVGALGGSALGAFSGSMGDTAVNSARNGKDFDLEFALKKATDEAVVDGLIGGTVELGIKGAKAVGGLARGAKEYAIDGNLNGARSLATKEAGLNPSEIHANRSAYETVPSEGGRELAQDELASAAMTRERLWNEVAPEVKGDVKASTEVANSTTSRANSLLEQAEKGAIEPEEVIKQIKAYENDVKTTYGLMVDDIAKIAPDFKATTDDIQATLTDAIDNVIGTETDAQLKKLLNIVQKQDSHSVQDLFALRKKVNAISTDNFEDLSVIRKLNEQLNDKIGAAIDTIPDEAMASSLKEGFNQNRQRYAEMFKMQDQDIYKDIMKSSINPEQASKKLMYYAKAYQDRLNEVTKNIAPEARAGIEMRVITDAIKDSLVETSDGFKAIDFKSLNEMIKKINTSNLKSENAKVLLETINDMHKLFGLDAQMLTDVAKGSVKQPMSGIATSITGRFEAMRTSFATKFLLSYLPTQAGKSMAFKRHVLESLRKARTPKEFLTLAEQYPNAPKTIWKQMRQTIDEYEQKLAQEQEVAFKQQEQEQIAKEARMAEKEAEKARQAEELKARAETAEFSSQELRVLTDMTSSNNERQAAMRLLQGQEKEGDKATVLGLKEKLGTKLDDEIARRSAREEELKAMREQAKSEAEFIKANQGSVQTGKSLSNADINSKFVSDEDARAEAYTQRFAGKGGTEYQGTTETLTAREQKSIDDGTATEDTLLKQRRIKQELEAKGLTPDEAPKATTGNKLLDSVVNKPAKPIEAPMPQGKPIEGTATAEESGAGMQALADDVADTVHSNLSDIQKEVVAEIGFIPKKGEDWSGTGKGNGELGVLDRFVNKVYRDFVQPFAEKVGFTPSKNTTQEYGIRDSVNLNRGRSLDGTFEGKESVYVDGLVFEKIDVENGYGDAIQYVKTEGDKYAVAKGISEQIDATFPKLAEEADIAFEPYGASLGFTSNLSFVKKFLANGKDYYVNVSSYFEPAKNRIYSAMKNKETVEEVRDALKAFVTGKTDDLEMMFGSHFQDFREIFKEATDSQKKTALDNFDYFAGLLQKDNLHLVSMHDSKMFKMAEEHGKQGKRVVLIDDSNYASLPFERTKDVYENPFLGFDRMVRNNEMTKEELEAINKFADANGIPKDDQFGKNPQYLLWQKQKAYDALTQNNGIVIATNNASPELVRGLSKYDGNIKVFWHTANPTPDTELGGRMRGLRPEYLAMFGGKNGTYTLGQGSNSFYQGKRFNDFGTNSGSKQANREVPRINGTREEKPIVDELPENISSRGTGSETRTERAGLEKSGPVDTKHFEGDDRYEMFSTPSHLGAGAFTGTANASQDYENKTPEQMATDFIKGLLGGTVASKVGAKAIKGTKAEDLIRSLVSNDDKATAGMFAKNTMYNSPKTEGASVHKLTKNKDGTPKVFYHGTASSFDDFTPTSHNHGVEAIYFTDKKASADNYSILSADPAGKEVEGANVRPVHLNIENPKVVRGQVNYDEMTKIIKKAKEDGHDSVVMLDVYDDQGLRYNSKGQPYKLHDGEEKTNTYIVFDKKKVSSVFQKPTTKELLQKLGL